MANILLWCNFMVHAYYNRRHTLFTSGLHFWDKYHHFRFALIPGYVCTTRSILCGFIDYKIIHVLSNNRLATQEYQFQWMNNLHDINFHDIQIIVKVKIISPESWKTQQKRKFIDLSRHVTALLWLTGHVWCCQSCRRSVIPFTREFCRSQHRHFDIL